jgi:hypothetical protein
VACPQHGITQSLTSAGKIPRQKIPKNNTHVEKEKTTNNHHVIFFEDETNVPAITRQSTDCHNAGISMMGTLA